MADEVLKRDQNNITVAGGVTNDANQEIRMLRIDPVTGGLITSFSDQINVGDGLFYVNSNDKKVSFGTDDPQDIDLTSVAGLIVRPLTNFYSAKTSDIGNNVLGIAQRIESYSGTAGSNIIFATLAGGTKASPTNTPGASSLFDIIAGTYIDGEWIPNGVINASTATDPEDGIIVTLSNNTTNISLLETGVVAIGNINIRINGVDYIYPSSAPIVDGYLHRAVDGTITFGDIANVPVIKDTVVLENQTASIGGTGLTTDSDAGVYRLSFYLVIDGTQGGESVTVNFQWDDGVQSQVTGGTINTTDGLYANGEIIIRKASLTAVSYSTSCTTTLTSADYNLYMTLEKIS